MPSPFPGMDPYLEDPEVFPDLHDAMIAEIRVTLNQLMPPSYFAGIGSRLWVDETERFIGPDVPILDRPDRPAAAAIAVRSTTSSADTATSIVVRVPHDEMRETFVEIRSTSEKRRLVTGIEILSLTNKWAGSRGRKLYVKKQTELLRRQVNLVEIDLLRAGDHSTAVPLRRLIRQAKLFDYHACVHRFVRPDEYTVYPISMFSRLPTIEIPLLPNDLDVTLDLQAVFDRCYDEARYERNVDYEIDEPVPPLSPEQHRWADDVLKRHREKSESS